MILKQGNSLLELLIATAILAVVFVTLVGSLSNLSLIQIKTHQRTQAVHLARESIEITYNISLRNWILFSQLSGTFHPQLDNESYTLSPGNEQIDNLFTRQLTLTPVIRDSHGNISSSGTPDPNSILVTSTVQWQTKSYQDQVEYSTILINHNFTPYEAN